MKIYYKGDEVKSDFFKNSSGAELALVFFEKISKIDNGLSFLKISDLNNDKNFKIFLLEKDGKYMYQPLGLCYNDDYVKNEFKREKNVKDIKEEILNKDDVFKLIDVEFYNVVKEIYSKFFKITKEIDVQDKLGEIYQLKLIEHSDLTIGDDVIVDEIRLYKKQELVGYLKSKYIPDWEEIKDKNVGKNELFFKKATTDFSRIKEEYQRKGLGYVLYFHMAQHLNKKGVSFRKSTCISEDAIKLWDAMEKSFPEYVVKEKIKSLEIGKKERLIDFFKIPENVKLIFENQKPSIKKLGV